MSYQKEYEERVMLTREQYSTLLLHYVKERKYIRIINNYVDTPKYTFRKHHCNLRVRDLGEEPLELTLKIKGNDGDTEITQHISYEQENEIFSSHKVIKGEVRSALQKLKLNPDNVRKWGYNQVERLEIVENDYTIVLDRNMIRNVVDYDLEIESNSMKTSKEVIKRICSEFNIEYKDKYLSKSSRTFAIYNL